MLALDVGGTKIAAARVDRAGNVLASARCPTPGAASPDPVWAAVIDLLEQVRGGDEVALGVGCGGPMARGGEVVSPLNIAGWRTGFALRSRLAETTGLVTVVENDAKALALAEGWMGAAQGCRNFLAMVVSTGVGGGIVLDGRLLEGAAGNAGHIGHVIVEPDGRLCACGARGCLEAEASGTAVAARTGRPAAEATTEVRLGVGRLVGRAVASVASLLDLRLAIVSGSVALGFGEAFLTAANEELGRSARLDHARGARLVPGALGAHGPLVGAAAVAWRHLDGGAGWC